MPKTKDKIKIGKRGYKVKATMRRFFLTLSILFLCLEYSSAQSFRLTVPNTVITGEKFKIVYTLQNAEGEGIRDPYITDGIRIISGPNVSMFSSSTSVNGRQSSSMTESFTYIGIAEKEGTFNIPGTTIVVNGKTIRSNSAIVKVLPPNKGSSAQSYNDPTSHLDRVGSDNTFVRAVVSKSRIYEQEAFVVSFKAYSTYQMAQVKNMEFPEFEGFISEDLFMASTLQNAQERYNGKTYYTAELKKIVLFPQRSGKITIPSGKADIVVVVRSGRQVQTPFGAQNLLTYSEQSVMTTPLTINIESLPTDKPKDFANAVGSFSAQANISATNIKANDGVTITLNINGNGNLKLIKTPEIQFPSEFEVYDPKITNNVQPTGAGGGLSGNKKIEYYFIPRSEGKYEIPATTFSYFNPSTGKYSQLQIPAYTLNVAKDPNGGKNNSATSYNQNKEKITDICDIKSGDYTFVKTEDFLFGSVGYYLWYIIPALLLAGSLAYYRKQLKENADIVKLKTKRANKVAIKRLKLAKTYLVSNNKEKFYEEILRATWGYLSDKLSIPVTNLNRENIELEMVRYGASQELIDSFIYILDTCEFARYSPVESHTVMDQFYNKAVDAIQTMESSLRKQMN
ncbi:MAG: BatD family protein [Dysgonomonas sp.]